MSFQSVQGHERVKQILQGSLKSGHIGHAYIFEGAAGIGRLSLAKAFAEEIVGCSGNFSADNHPDIIVVTNELYNSSKKQANVLVDTIRSMKADVYIRPYMSNRKVYIIPNADSMQEPAQNSLLKVFEEPPEYCTIILIASNSGSLLPTILSRASVIRLNALSPSLVEDYLLKNKGIEPSLAKAYSVMSNGSIGYALSLSEEAQASEIRAEVIAHLRRVFEGGHRELYDFIRFLKQNKSSVQLILNIMTSWSRDLMHLKLGVLTDGIENSDAEAELKKICSRITTQTACSLTPLVTKYSLAINRNANYPIAVQCMATEYWEEIHGRSYRSSF